MIHYRLDRGRRWTRPAICCRQDGCTSTRCACAPFRSAPRSRRSSTTHDRIFIVEQNRDAQMRTLLAADFPLEAAQVRFDPALTTDRRSPPASSAAKSRRECGPGPPPRLQGGGVVTYLAKPKFHHPALEVNALGFTHRDYEGAISTLCAGCGHDSISAAIMRACFELEPAAASHRQAQRHRLLLEDADLHARPEPRLQLRAWPHALGADGRQPRQSRSASISAFPATATPPRSGSASSRMRCGAAST